jgi:hypothetical protein
MVFGEKWGGTAVKYSFGNREVEMGGKYLTELRNSNDILGDVAALQKRMAEDGYLLIRGFHDSDKVQRARLAILQRLAAEGRLAADLPVAEGIAGKKSGSKMFGGTNKDMPELLDVVNSPKLMDFFTSFMGGEAITYDYKWVRAVPPGGTSGAHYDIVYMGRGTRNVYTVWTPLGDVPMEKGSLALCLGSQNFDQVREIYGALDVDSDRTNGGILTEDPVEIVDKFGGRWATTNFQAGDIIIFGMFLLHFSLRNSTNCYRTSVDTRFQLKSEPADHRWVGESPIAHYSRKEGPPLKSMDEYRQKLGLGQ